MSEINKAAEEGGLPEEYDRLHSLIVEVLSKHRMVRMFEVEEFGLGNSYPLIDRLCLDDGADVESGQVEVDALAWAIADKLVADRASRQVANKAKVDEVRKSLQYIHDTFKRDLDAGYITRDKQSAVEIAAEALATPPATTGGANATPTGASTVLTDERIEKLWEDLPLADTFRKIRRDFARAIEREIKSAGAASFAAQAGQIASVPPAVAVPEGFAWPEPPNGGQSHVLFDDGYVEGWTKAIDTVRKMLAGAPSPAKESK